MKRILYLDLVGGVAGDMLLAALLDLGLPIDELRSILRHLGLNKVSIEASEVFPAGIRAQRVDVRIDGIAADTEASHGAHTGHRAYREIVERLEASALSHRVKSGALATFKILAEAEARVHGKPVDTVHFHEVGADDAIADIVGVAWCLERLGVDAVHCSPIPLGHGIISGSHGPMAVPAPATVEIVSGLPVQGADVQGEMSTPTGVALLKALATAFGPMPAMRMEKTGTGAGHRQWPDRPNVLRAFLGVQDRGQETALGSEESWVIETNLDDMNPQHFGPLRDALFEAGADDVWWSPISMKKDRPAVLVSVLARETVLAGVESVIFRFSTSLGTRRYPVLRTRRERSIREVSTEFGTVRVKLSGGADDHRFATAEFDDCVRLGRAHGVPPRVVQEAALRAAWES
jgi:pyridinium-3,5-bisthiocarboxylic acid mononucleotide nickel chelatase